MDMQPDLLEFIRVVYPFVLMYWAVEFMAGFFGAAIKDLRSRRQANG